MSAVTPLQQLARKLEERISAMGLHTGEFGKPSMVEETSRQAEQLFQGYTKAKPRKEDAYAAARAFLRGQLLDAWQRDLIASAVAEPIHEESGAMVLGSKRFSTLLASYEAEAEAGQLWRLTWHGLLYSYFNFNPQLVKEEETWTGWEALRSFLLRTWPTINRQVGDDLVPDWVTVLRNESDVFTSKAVDKYAKAYLRGETQPTDRLGSDLGIPPSSWFWHALVLGAVRSATGESDAEFQRLVSELVQLVQRHPGFRDEALETILLRYHACKDAPPNEQLRDFVCQRTVWGSPALGEQGMAPAWHRVPEPVRKMVDGWVNEQRLKDFFDILAARNNADEGRLEFWSKYLKQISWTRLVFGADTMLLTRTNAGVRELIAREEGAYAQLVSNHSVDAFMMRVGSYVIVEFSKKPNACYVYQSDQLPFALYDAQYEGGTEDLRAGFNGHYALRIVHRDGWGVRAEHDLRGLGIFPDAPTPRRARAPEADRTSANSTTSERSTQGKVGSARRGPDMTALRALISRFRGASIDDRRSAQRGRLWVEDPLQRVQLDSELKALGFRWANSRCAWYFPED